MAKKKDPCATCDEEMMACYDCPHNPDLDDDDDDDDDDIDDINPDGMGMEMDDDAADINPDDESAYEFNDDMDGDHASALASAGFGTNEDYSYDASDEEELTLD